MRLAFSILALVALAPSRSLAEEDEAKPCEVSQVLEAYGIGTPWDELVRMAEDVGAAPLRPELIRRAADRTIPLCETGPALPMGRRAPPPEPGLVLVPGTLNANGNTTYPHGFNDGALWQGKGVSAQLAAGASFRFGVLSAAVVPSVAWQQNAAFQIVPTGRPGDLAFMDPWYGDGIDLPQRFGDGPFWTASPGQSYLRIDYQGFAAGISTENMWWGPGMRNSILMSNTAAGFPHALLGTGRPVDIGIGNLEAQAYMGRLDRSKYFSDESHAWFYGLVMDYEPRWVPGLYLGVAGVNLKSCACFHAPDSNSLAGAYVRWVFPPVGLEVYGEWTREDNVANIADFLRQPDHSAAYSLGLQKVWAGSARWVRFRAEATDVAPLLPPQQFRPGPVVYYVHPGNLSYTNGGQLIGAGIGPGASSQYLGLDVLTGSGWYGGYLERVRRHEDVYLYQLGGPWAKNDVEITVGLRYVRSFGILDLSADLGLSHRYNRDFVAPGDKNAHLGVELTLWPEREGAPR